MLKNPAFFFLILVLSGSNAFAKGKEHSVRGYTKSDGTTVSPHYRSNPNLHKSDNYTARGNTNPHTGEAGTKSSYGLNEKFKDSGSHPQKI